MFVNKILIFLSFFCFSVFADKYIAVFEPGAILGYRQTKILEGIEVKTGKAASEIFDFMGGTSTGSIIASLASLAREDGSPMYSATDIRRMYENIGRQIFSPKQKKQVSIREILAEQGFTPEHLVVQERFTVDLANVANFQTEINDEANFETYLRQYLGEKTLLSSLKIPVAIFTLRFEVQKFYTEILPYYLSGAMGMANSGKLIGLNSFEHGNVNIVDAIRGSSAPGRLFIPHNFVMDNTKYTFVDGACSSMSTLESTLEIAREKWPDENLYVFNFGASKIEGELRQLMSLPPENHKNVERIFYLSGIGSGVGYDDPQDDRKEGVPEVCDFDMSSNVSDEHFAEMSRQADSFILKSKEFQDAIDFLKALNP